MKIPEIPHNEIERLKALYEYDILDSIDEQEYNDITRMASDICMTPISVISIVDSHRQWFKSKVGLEAKQTDREISFCGHAINQPNEIMIVKDATKDERFFDNPLVKDKPNIVFYAGVPLVDENGFALGTICALDNQPRELNEQQIDSLKLLAKKVVEMLSLRKKNKELSETKKFLIESINFSSPFFLLIDKSNVIQEFGSNFSKSNPEMKKGDFFHEYFKWESAFNTEEFLTTDKQYNKLLFFTAVNKKQKFKCSVKKYDEKSFFIFATGVINIEYSISNYNLKLTDFPKHDYIAEFLFLQQSATKGLEDSKKLNENLLEKNKQLESARLDLINVNNKLEEKVNERTKKVQSLALFPEQNPNPVFELDYQLKTISYCNPVAKKQILKERDISYEQCLEILKIDKETISSKSIKKIEFVFEDKFFERNMFFLDNNSVIRLYLHDITEIRKKELEENRKKQNFIERQQILIDLRSLSNNINFEEKLKLVLKSSAVQLKAKLSSFYTYENDKKQLRCKFVFNRLESSFNENKSIELKQLPFYYKKLTDHKVVFVSNNSTSEEAEEIRQNLLNDLHIKTSLDIPVFKSEELVGVLRFKYEESLSAINDDDISFATRIGDIISLLFEAEKLRQSRKELKEKNEELQNSYNRLLELQTEIVKQEKLATLGMLIAGIAHEINTPLGAIKASNENISDGLKRELSEKLSEIEPDNSKLAFELFMLNKKRRDLLSTREEREIYKKLEQDLRIKLPEIENTSFYARKIFDLGYTELAENLIPYLKNKEANLIFTIASSLVRIIKSSDTIGLAVDKAARVVKALNSFSHGNITNEISNFNLKESIDSIVVLLWNKIKKGATVINEIEEQIELFGNQEELSQVWTNILNNALQASDNQCIIKISHQFKNGEHELIFSNNGPAIPEQQLPKIFDAFFSTKKRGEGTGLGLNIVKKIIEKHEGTIRCESNASETKFIINIKQRQ